MAKFTYTGPETSGRVVMPSRSVPFTADATVEFTADEAPLLPPEWVGKRARGSKPPAAAEDIPADQATTDPAPEPESKEVD